MDNKGTMRIFFKSGRVHGFPITNLKGIDEFKFEDDGWWLKYDNGIIKINPKEVEYFELEKPGVKE